MAEMINTTKVHDHYGQSVRECHASKITNSACNRLNDLRLSCIYPRDNWLLEEAVVPAPAPPPPGPPPVSLLVLLLYQRSAGDVDRKKCPLEGCWETDERRSG